MPRGRPKTHPDTTPRHPNRLSERAIDLLRRVVIEQNGFGIQVDDARCAPTLKKLGLIRINMFDENLLYPTDAGLALIEKMDKQNAK